MPVSARKARISVRRVSDIERIISALADRSSALYRVRDKIAAIADIPGMGNGTWRERFSDAVARSGMSQREISVAAGRAPGYVYGILKENKDPDHR